MAEIVGTAYVRIRALTNQLGSDIKQGVDKGITDAEPTTEKGGKRLGGTMTDSFGDGMGDLGPNMSNNIEDASEDSKKTTDKEGEKHGKSFGDHFDSEFKKRMKKGGGPFAFLQKTRLAWYAILGVPALAGAAKLVGFYLVGLVAQLGFVATAAVGAGAALGGLFVGAGLGIVPLVMAFKTETVALEQFKETLKDIGKEWEVAGQAAQEGLLPALEVAARTVTDSLLPAFTEYSAEIGRIAGNTAILASEILTSADNQKSLQKIFDVSAKIVQELSDAFLDLFDAFIPLLEAAMPMARNLAKIFGDWAEQFSEFIQAQSRTGELTATFREWWERAKLIGGALKNLWDALWNVLEIGGSTGTTFFDTLAELADKWEKFTESPEGIEQIRTMFRRARPVMKQVNGILGDIIGWITEPIRTGRTSGIVDFLKMIRRDFLPALEALFDALNTPGMAAALTTLVEGIADFVTQLSESGGSTAILDTITGMLDTLGTIMSDPKWGPTLVNLLELGVAFAVMNSVLGGFPLAMLQGIGFALGKLVVGGIVSGLGSLATYLTISVGALLGWVAVIVAVVLAAIWVWKNWDKVKVWLGQAWDKIKEFATLVGDWLKELPGKITAWFASAPEAFIGWIQEIWPRASEALANFAMSLMNWITELPGQIVGWIADTSWVEAGAGLFGWLNPAVEGLANILTFLGEVFNRVFNAVIQVWTNVFNTVVNLLDNIWRLVTTIFDSIIKVVTGFFDVIAGLFTGDWARVWDGVKAIFDGVWDGIAQAIIELPGMLADIVVGLGNAALDAGTAIVTGILDGLGAAGGAIWDFAGDVGRAFLDFINDNIIGPIKNFTFEIDWKIFHKTFNPFGGLPYLAKGGIIMSPTIAMIGEGRGGEAIIPLDRLSAMLDGGPGAGTAQINVYVRIGERDITDIVDTRVSRSQRNMARVLHTGRGR